MQNLPVLCLLTTFIASGASLSCEVCEGLGHTCKGALQTCPPGFDACGIVQSESTSGLQSKAIMKTCSTASDCDKGTIILNLGSLGRMMTKYACCAGNDCSKDPPPLPPLNDLPNWKTCPACYSLHGLECKEEIIQCAGDEIFCFELAGSAVVGEMTVTTVMKGCTNAATCNETSHRSGSFAGISMVASSKCTLAPHIPSGTDGSTPEFVRLFFQASAGILLVRLLG